MRVHGARKCNYAQCKGAVKTFVVINGLSCNTNTHTYHDPRLWSLNTQIHTQILITYTDTTTLPHAHLLHMLVLPPTPEIPRTCCTSTRWHTHMHTSMIRHQLWHFTSDIHTHHLAHIFRLPQTGTWDVIHAKHLRWHTHLLGCDNHTHTHTVCTLNDTHIYTSVMLHTQHLFFNLY